MENDINNFEIVLLGMKLKVQKHSINGEAVFRVVYPDNRRPLVLTRAIHSEDHFFWTSIPEGRQAEAEAVGAQISQYYKSVG